MVVKQTRFAPIVLFWVVWFSFGLAGCRTAAPEVTLTEAPAVEVTAPTLPPAATETPQPTPTQAAPKGILLAPVASDPNLAAAIRQVLQPAVEGAGLVFEEVSALTPAEVGPEVRLVVALPPDAGITTLAQAAPNTQFLAVGIAGVQAGPNLSTLGAQGDRPDLQAFLAGYLAAVNTQDWRVGIISVSDSPAGKAARNAFLNGVVYLCGLCRPTYPPFVQYPLYGEAPAGASAGEWQAAADGLIAQGVRTIYVFPGAGDESLLQYLAQKEVDLIGGTAPSAGLSARWMASIRPDPVPALVELLPGLLSGQGGQSRQLPLVLTDLNPERLTPGKQVFVQKFLDTLLTGIIDTGVDLESGDIR